MRTKILSLLVLLLTAATGAWAEEEVLLTTVTATGMSTYSQSPDGVVTVVVSGNDTYDADWGWYRLDEGTATITVTAAEGYTITRCVFKQYPSDNPNRVLEDDQAPFVMTINGAGIGFGSCFVEASNGQRNGPSSMDGASVIEVYGPAASSATGPEVAWNKASKTGTFTMPGGNVELEPEYYPQAALTAAPTAINDVPATTDGAIVKAGTVANIGETTTAQGTVMYYVSTSTMTTEALLALAADAWTADVPTAQSLAQGPAYVYYYVRGNDSDTDEENFSDGDILAANALTVTIAAASTYAVTFAEGTDPNEWTASPNADVKKGQTVTVTYTGSKKVIGVKAEKKAAAKPVTLATALEDGATIKVNFKWRDQNKGDYVQGVYNAASGTFTASKGGGSWGKDGRAVYKVEKSGDNIIIGAGFSDYNTEGMVWTFNTTNDTYTTTNGAEVNQFPNEYGLISVSVNDTDITSTLSELK